MVDKHEAHVEQEHHLVEDDEDRWIREGEAAFAAMPPEEQVRIRRHGDEILAQMQTPGNRDAVDQVFRRTAGSD